MKCLFDNNMPPKLAKTLNFLEGDEGIPVIHLP
jgi:predicted nuclease of predicted toxin-antitoxin system